MQDNGKLSSAGMSFTSVLTLIFIVLKILGVIEWSWVWVLSPLWVSMIVFLAIVMILAAIEFKIFKKLKKKKKKIYGIGGKKK